MAKAYPFAMCLVSARLVCAQVMCVGWQVHDELDYRSSYYTALLEWEVEYAVLYDLIPLQTVLCRT